MTTLLFIGPFPPPVHGASAVTLRAFDAVAASGVAAIKADVAPVPGGSHHAGRLKAYRQVMAQVLAHPKAAPVYISLSGGMGLAYDVALVALCAMRGHPLVFHHHSYAYLNRKSGLMAAIVGLSGLKARHVLLSPAMAAKFTQVYGANITTLAVSNMAFFPLDLPPAQPPRELSTLGYLSNINREKGIDRFLDLMQTLRHQGSKLSARIAGPFTSPEVETYVRGRISDIGGIDYVGPVYGAQKEDFLASLDFFVFPTRYGNEAQPMVVFEARLHGLPVALSDRGTLKDMVSPYDTVLDAEARDLDGLTAHLLQLEASPDAYAQLHAHTLVAREQLVEESRAALAAFLHIFNPDRA